MKQAILHIGLEKTGTSSLQEFLQLNRNELLLGEQIWVPAFMGRGSQWPLAIMAYNEDRCDDLTAPLGDAATRQCRIEEIQQQIIAAVEHNPARTCCFSSEHLSSRLSTREELIRLKAFFSALFETITIILYLREPILLAISRQSTFVKMGLGSFQLPTPQQLACGFDFRAIINLWQSVFPGRLCIRLFDPSRPGFDLIEDFCGAIGINDSSRYQRPQRVNESLDWTVMRLLSRINGIAAEEQGQPLPRPALERLVPMLERLAGRSGQQRRSYIAPAQAVEAYRSYFADREQWLLRSFFPERTSLWHCPYSPTAAESQPPADPEPSLAVSDAEELLCRVIVELAMERSLPINDLAHCLEQVAWKSEQGQPLNLYDQQTCRGLARQLRPSG